MIPSDSRALSRGSWWVSNEVRSFSWKGMSLCKCFCAATESFLFFCWCEIQWKTARPQNSACSAIPSRSMAWFWWCVPGCFSWKVNPPRRKIVIWWRHQAVKRDMFRDESFSIEAEYCVQRVSILRCKPNVFLISWKFRHTKHINNCTYCNTRGVCYTCDIWLFGRQSMTRRTYMLQSPGPPPPPREGRGGARGLGTGRSSPRLYIICNC